MNNIVSFTKSNPTFPKQQQVEYDSQLLILESEQHLLIFLYDSILHAKQKYTNNNIKSTLLIASTFDN